MTKPAAVTEATLRRAIRAAQRSGLRVTGIAPDGTVLVSNGENGAPDETPTLAPAHHAADARRWGDDQ